MRKHNTFHLRWYFSVIMVTFACVLCFANLAIAQNVSSFTNSGLRNTVYETNMPYTGLRRSLSPDPLQNVDSSEFFSFGTAKGDLPFRQAIHDPLFLLSGEFANSSTIAASQTTQQTVDNLVSQMNSRVGRTATRVGQSIDDTVQSQSNASLLRRSRKTEIDPYAAIGLKWGAFMVYPAVEIAGGLSSYKSNAGGERATGAEYRILPELRLDSLWARHALNINLRGGFEYLENSADSERPFLEVDTIGRYDISTTQNLQLGALYRYDTETPYSLDAQITGQPADVQQLQGRAVYTQEFGYLQMALRSTFTNSEYQDAFSTSGITIRNSDRSVFIADYALRGTYNRGTLLAPFAEIGHNDRSFENSVDSQGYRRDSDGWRIRGGLSIAQGDILSGEIALGYLEQSPEDDRFVTLRAGIVDGNITWRPNALTTIIVAVSTDVNTTPTIGSSGYLSQRGDLAIRHALRRELILNAGLTYGQDAFQDINRTDDFYEIRGGADYFMNRFMSLRGLARYEIRDSSISGQSYNNLTIEARLRLQR